MPSSQFPRSKASPSSNISIDLATAWGIGPKQKARGVLILLAPNDRKYRIEVGYGLEGILPDGKVGGFGREAVPFLRQNDYSGAVLLMTERVAASHCRGPEGHAGLSFRRAASGTC